MLLAAFDHASRGGDHGPHVLFPLFLLILLGLGIAWVIRRKRGGGSGHATRSAMYTLQDRFARGEIDRAEYDHRKAVLDGDDVIPAAPATAPVPPSSSPEGPDGEE